jgi:uncharacterized protein YbaR (Trm112 family)
VHIELVDVLRCPNVHEDSWLVASIDEMQDREIVRGALGCPRCASEYRIEERTVLMGEGVVSPPAPPDEADTMKLAAMLDLIEPSSYVLLAGAWSAHASRLRQVIDQRFIILNAPPNVATELGSYGVRAARGILPFAAGSARGIALEQSHAELAPRAAAALRAGGRLVAPATTPVPEGLNELARDDEVWVAERVAAPRLVRLQGQTTRD